MRRLALLIIVFSIVAALVFVEKRPDTGRVGLNAVMRLVADFERQVERIPLTATRVSDSEETEVGRRLALHYHLSTTDPYLERVGQLVAARVNRKGIAYRFYLDDQAGVNAFALPGGQIVVGPGMLKLMESEDELAALLGHEITHVDRRHTIERFQYELSAVSSVFRYHTRSLRYPLQSFAWAIQRNWNLKRTASEWNWPQRLAIRLMPPSQCRCGLTRNNRLVPKLQTQKHAESWRAV